MTKLGNYKVMKLSSCIRPIGKLKVARLQSCENIKKSIKKFSFICFKDVHENENTVEQR